MSQQFPAPLTEEEIIQYINSAFNLRLEKDALIKPVKEVIVDIYTRFLDDTHFPWRKPPKNINPDNFNMKAAITGWLQFIFKQFEPNGNFQIIDLITPTRKRTAAFLTILMFFRDRCLENRAWWEEKKKERLEKREAVVEIHKHISEKRLALEELAIKKSQIPDAEELNKLVHEEQCLFETARREADRLQEVVKPKIKEELATVQQLEREVAIECQTLEEEVNKLKSTLDLLNDGPKLKVKCRELEDAISREVDQSKKKEEILHKLNMEISELRRLSQNLNEIRIFEITPDLKSVITRAHAKQNDIQNQIVEEHKKRESLSAEERRKMDKLEHLETERQRLISENKIFESNSQLQLNAKEEAIKKLIHEREQHIKQLKNDLMKLEFEEKAIQTKKDLLVQQYQGMVEKLERPMAKIKKRLNDSVSHYRATMSKHFELQENLSHMIGDKQDTTINMQVATQPSILNTANRTYTKELY